MPPGNFHQGHMNDAVGLFIVCQILLGLHYVTVQLDLAETESVI